MQERVIEILKNPDIINHNDVELLQSEIEKYPYVQSLRALHLLGLHRFQKEDYNTFLATTAAYTTDKKILYYQVNEKKVVLEQQEEELLPSEPLLETIQEIDDMVANNNEELIIAQESELDVYVQYKKPEYQLDFFDNIIYDEKEITSNLQEESSQNFQQTDNFLPDVKFSIPTKSVEKQSDIKGNEELIKEEIPLQKAKESVIEEVKVNPIEEEKSEEQHHDWKPLNFTVNTPDSLIGKNEIPSVPVPSKSLPSVQQIKQQDRHTPIEEPVRVIKPIFKKEQLEEKNISSEETSNVSSFINTWQNWLRLNPPAKDPSEKLLKSKVIDNFIENSPKISPLKADQEIVVKEQDSDISHLMTETLANMYFNQKYYDKAISAYEILIRKYPEKEASYHAKINEIKNIKDN